MMYFSINTPFAKYSISLKFLIQQTKYKMETTEIEDIINNLHFSDDEFEFESDTDENNLPKIVTDLSYSLDKRIIALEKYYEVNGDNVIEIIRTLSSMYQMSGSKLIERFFYNICSKALISSFIKVEAAKCLLDYEETGDEDRIKENNEKRKILGYKALEHVCYDLSEMPAPCRVEAIFLLMKSKVARHNADFYFKEFIKTDNIDCEFRYSSILSLEKIGADEMKEELYEYSKDEEVLKKIFTYLSEWTTPSMKKTKRNCHYILFRLSYLDIKSIYQEMIPNKECGKDWFIKSAQLAFLFYTKIPIYFCNLSGQYLLKNCELEKEEHENVEKRILDFAEDQELDYNLRADAADILLRFGSEAFKQAGRKIIMELGRVNGYVRTVFDNAQNVHTEEVEESVVEILEFLSTFSLYNVNGNPVDFDYVNAHVEKMLKEEINQIQKGRELGDTVENSCKYCKCHIEESSEIKFCSEVCDSFYIRNDKIAVAMKRIFMDRALYSKFNNSLLNILLKIYTYIQMQEDIKTELYKRMLQELEAMSGTCSSGFASRLVNIISGFGNFNIRISFEDQIISNFTGRLNAKARSITSPNSIFRLDRVEDVVELWLLNNENRLHIETKLNTEKKFKIKDLVSEFLSENREEKIEECVQFFAESVFNEMMVKSSKSYERRSFGLFFRTHMPSIRQELADEFKEFISETDFDLFFRKAIMIYEGES